ncbi:MAG TPA: hypothetical protein VGP47_06350, partial [Parachlamydiaceae bacterium]|nr:hypothetical protein [Parachlamydiaceae bacterium]
MTRVGNGDSGSINSDQGIPPKDPINNQEEIIERDSQTAAEIGHKVLGGENEKPSGRLTPVDRENIVPNDDISLPKIGNMITDYFSNKEVKSKKSEMAHIIRNSSAFTLQNEELSLGRKKILGLIIEDPEVFRKDIDRLKITIGRQPPPVKKDGDTAEMRRETYSKAVQKYILSTNPALVVDQSKVDEILYSLTQIVAGDMEQSRSDVLPTHPWSRTSTKHEERIQFEKKGLFSKPEVLVTSIIVTLEYKNSENPETKPRNVTYVAQVKHDLVKNDVSFNYALTMDGMTEQWDPTIRFTTEDFHELFPTDATLDSFREKLTLDGYDELKNEIQILNDYVSKDFESLVASAQNNPDGFVVMPIPEIKGGKMMELLVTKNGDVFLRVPVAEFARGGEKTTNFVVQLFSEGQSLLQKNQPSKFAPTIFPDIKGSQIGVLEDDADQLSFQGGEKKVLEKIQDFHNIVKPVAVKTFKLDGSSSNSDGVI